MARKSKAAIPPVGAPASPGEKEPSPPRGEPSGPPDSPKVKTKLASPKSMSMAAAVERGRRAVIMLGLSGEARRMFLVTAIPNYWKYVKMRRGKTLARASIPCQVHFAQIVSRLDRRVEQLGLTLSQWGHVLEILCPELFASRKPRPTRAEPGSVEKIREMERRASLCLALHHDGDAKLVSWVARFCGGEGHLPQRRLMASEDILKSDIPETGNEIGVAE